MALVKQLARSVRTAGSVHSAWFHHQGCVRHRPFSSQCDWPAVLREALVPPAAQEDKFRSLSNCKKYKPGSQSLSQILQDRWVDEAFQGQQNLFAVECGAFDGELESNTIWLETEKKKNGSAFSWKPTLYLQIFAFLKGHAAMCSKQVCQ